MFKIKNILIPYFLSIVITLFVLLPLYHNLLTERAILVKEKEKLEGENIYIEAMKIADKELEPYDLILRKIESGIPLHSSIPSVIKHLELLVLDSGLQLISIGPFTTSRVIKRPHLHETRVEMKVVGNDYSSLKNFLKELERSVKIITIESASISLIEEEERTRFELALAIKTYSY